MKRREFLKVVGVGAGLAALPQALAGQIAPTTVADLAGWLESNFVCSFGAPWAFVETRSAEFEDRPNDPDWWKTPDSRDYSKLTPYHTYKVEAPSQREALAAYYGLFAGFLAEHPEAKGTPLYWRLPDKVELRTELRRSGGEMVATCEQVEDGHDVDGLEEDENGNYWRNRHSIDVTLARTRLAIPALQRAGIQPDKSYANGWWGASIVKIGEGVRTA